MNTFLRGLKQTFNPKRDIEEIVTLRPRELFLMAMMILATVLAFIYDPDDMSYLGLLTGIFTTINLILIDRGRLTNFLWGIGSCTVWLMVAFQNMLIGDIATQSFYFIMQFVGIYAWQKNLEAGEQKEVKPRKLSKKLAVLSGLGTIVLYFIMVYISKKANGNQVWVDSTILPISIVAQILMTYGYRSQWVFWILLNAINVVIWTVQLSNGGTAALPMLVLNIMMLVNSLYGMFVWYNEEQE